MTPAEAQARRKFLRWGIPRLAREARVSFWELRQYEAGGAITDAQRARILRALGLAEEGR